MYYFKVNRNGKSIRNAINVSSSELTDSERVFSDRVISFQKVANGPRFDVDSNAIMDKHKYIKLGTEFSAPTDAHELWEEINRIKRITNADMSILHIDGEFEEEPGNNTHVSFDWIVTEMNEKEFVLFVEWLTIVTQEIWGSNGVPSND